MKNCSNCEAEFDTKHSKCQDCRGVKPLGLGAKNFKWRVAIEVCDQGHAHVPVNGSCLVCNPSAGAPKKCAYCKIVTVLGKNKFCSKKCSTNNINNQLTDKTCMNCGCRLKVYQNSMCSLKCNGEYKQRKIAEVLASLPEM